MNRILLLLLCVLLLATLSACSGEVDSTSVPTSSEEILFGPGISEFSSTGSQGLEYALNDDGVSCTVTGIGDCKDLYITIGASIDGYPVTAIGDSAFYCNTDIKGIQLGEHVERIGAYAFFECTSLDCVSLGNAVTSLGKYAFAGCVGLESIALPSSVTQLDSWAFYDCYGLKAVHIDNLRHWFSISFGGPYANPLQCAGELFVKDQLVTELSIPDEIQVIGSWTLAGCTSLTSLSIHENVLEISHRAFAKCENLTQIHFDGTVAQWDAIDKRSYWDFSIDDYTVHCLDGEAK